MKITVLSSHTSSLFWFRMDMMKEFIQRGHTVTALGPEPEAKWKDKFQEKGIDYKQIHVERNGINPINDFRTYQELKRFMKKEKPDKVFAYQAKTLIYGSLAAKANGIKEVYLLIAGLGSIFRGSGFKNRIIRMILKAEYRAACKASKRVFFQNHDDIEEFINNQLIKKDKVVLINGSGVNLDEFQPEPLPERPAFLLIGRLIKDKGVMEYLEACRHVKALHSETRCLLVGPYDSNPSALKPEEIESYIKQGIVEYFGEQDDVRPFIRQCSTYVLPSYYEGTPKTVLEAMAMGRPIITCDAPGCRDAVMNGKNGYLVQVRNVEALAEKMVYMIENLDICKIMGIESYKLAREKYDVNLVNHSIMCVMGLG